MSKFMVQDKEAALAQAKKFRDGVAEIAADVRDFVSKSKELNDLGMNLSQTVETLEACSKLIGDAESKAEDVHREVCNFINDMDLIQTADIKL